MPIENRTTTITGVFAEDASTTIPTTPISGESYRNTALTEAEANEGWKYKNIVDSADVNQVLFEVTKILKLIETFGFLTWSALTDYVAGSYCLGTDGKIYRAKQATGPSTTALDPVNDSSNTYWEDYFGSTYMTLGTTQTATGTKTFYRINLAKNDSNLTGGKIDFLWADNESNAGKSMSIYRYNGKYMIGGHNSSNVSVTPLVVDVENNTVTSNGVLYAPASDTNGTAVTTVNKTKAANGYVKLGNGIIIQWGRWSDSTDPSITFPTAFSNTNYSITTNDQRNTTNANANVYENKTNTGVKIHSQQTNGNWIAIGY